MTSITKGSKMSSSTGLKTYLNQFWPGLRPGTHWGSLPEASCPSQEPSLHPSENSKNPSYDLDPISGIERAPFALVVFSPAKNSTGLLMDDIVRVLVIDGNTLNVGRTRFST